MKVAQSSVPRALPSVESSATKDVKNFNLAVKHTLDNPGDYTMPPVSTGTWLLHGFTCGLDGIPKRAFDPERSPGYRAAAGTLGWAAPLLGAAVGVPACFIALPCAADYLRDNQGYKATKKVHNQRKAIRKNLEALDRDLKPYFSGGKPKDLLRSDLAGLAKALEESKRLLSTTSTERLGMRDPAKVPRKYLAAINNVPAQPEDLAGEER